MLPKSAETLTGSQVDLFWTSTTGIGYALLIRTLTSAFIFLMISGYGGGGGGSSTPPAVQTTTPEPEHVWEYTAPEERSDGWSVSNLRRGSATVIDHRAHDFDR